MPMDNFRLKKTKILFISFFTAIKKFTWTVLGISFPNHKSSANIQDTTHTCTYIYTYVQSVEDVLSHLFINDYSLHKWGMSILENLNLKQIIGNYSLVMTKVLSAVNHLQFGIVLKLPRVFLWNNIFNRWYGNNYSRILEINKNTQVLDSTKSFRHTP